MNKTTAPEFLTAFVDEMEYAMNNTNLVTRTLVCDYCPNEWEIDAPADWKPAVELTCAACHDEWFSWPTAEDAYLDSYWESLYE